MTQHKLDWLLGDAGAGGRRAKLPVDAYWPGHQLVVEYRELQHDQPMPHFDKPDRLTVRLRRCPIAGVGLEEWERSSAERLDESPGDRPR